MKTSFHCYRVKHSLSRQLGIMPHRKASRRTCDLKFEEISNPILPKGWKRVLVKRQTGKTKDIVDIYVIASDGAKLRSSIEVLKHMSKTKTPYKVGQEECVNLFTKAYLKAENFANHNLLIKLMPSLASESEREKMGITLPIKRRGRPKKIITDENIACQEILSKSPVTSGMEPQKENSVIGFQVRKRGRPKSIVADENIACQEILSKSPVTSGMEPKKENSEIGFQVRKRGRPKNIVADENIACQEILSKSPVTSGMEPQKENSVIGFQVRKRGRPKSIVADENIACQEILSKSPVTSGMEPQKENSEIGFQVRKRGRPKNIVAVENEAYHNQLTKSGNNPQKESLGLSFKPRKRGRPKRNSAAESIANQNQPHRLIPTLDSRPLKENLGVTIKPRKRGRPKSSDAAKHFVLINRQAKLVSTLGKEQKIFKSRKRRSRPTYIRPSDKIVSLSNGEIEEKSTDKDGTRANKSVQTDDFLFTFKNESNNEKSYNCVNTQDNLHVIENIPTEMVFTTFESGDVDVPKKFTYLPSSVSDMKWDSVSGTYAIDVDGKVIPSIICNDEEYSRLDDEASGENSFTLSPDVKDLYDSEIIIEEFEDSKMCEVDSTRNYIINHSCAVTICHRPKTRHSTWIPPRSPYNIIQQLLYDDPWKLLISTFFEECQDPKHFWQFIDKWPSAKQLLRVNVRFLADFLQNCGIHRLRAGTFLKFTDDFLHSDWVDPMALFGIQNFGRECYILFYLGEWNTFNPKSGMLKLYLNWYNENFVAK